MSSGRATVADCGSLHCRAKSSSRAQSLPLKGGGIHYECFTRNPPAGVAASEARNSPWICRGMWAITTGQRPVAIACRVCLPETATANEWLSSSCVTALGPALRKTRRRGLSHSCTGVPKVMILHCSRLGAPMLTAMVQYSGKVRSLIFRYSDGLSTTSTNASSTEMVLLDAALTTPSCWTFTGPRRNTGDATRDHCYPWGSLRLSTLFWALP